MAKSSVSMKLLIDKEAGRVLYAEASKDCVDFLFYVLSLPVAKLISLVGKQQMVGCLANLYDSIENLNDSYIQPNRNKNTYLKPAVIIPPTSCSYVPLLALEDSFYTCNNPTAVCPSCRRFVNMAMHYVYPRGKKRYCEEGVGFVRGVVSYMVMDDLVVKPMSTISTLTLLNNFNVKEVGALQEKVVHLGMPQAVKLLKASLETDRVLTTVFLKGPR
ncbi:hypothetical protein MIMGU_mgv1a020619mg [Erythranthe guttata]|uniref:DUF674 domain-containing protein n=1 Tax=Erythranthe guttata TaxID=4155 RepID=A0A022QN07_ERYGU|nr:PREDICTED: uncharacterized protein LOC105967375 [Erythranthe guttata]EYU28959.1 hypothetical protein MIMGU_mgv1a020619mg [Erythranthe guttata]|eukprot:XP_012847428.1 PREDICTED: uncharacterized protein LOC105967375 [Erythranthe guttata]